MTAVTSAEDMEARIVAPTRLPFPTRLGISCPTCEAVIEFEPAEDDAGSFHAEDEWPACEACNILIEVQPIRVVSANGTYHATRRF